MTEKIKSFINILVVKFSDGFRGRFYVSLSKFLSQIFFFGSEKVNFQRSFVRYGPKMLVFTVI